jgi:hypothetical protein
MADSIELRQCDVFRKGDIWKEQTPRRALSGELLSNEAVLMAWEKEALSEVTV